MAKNASTIFSRALLIKHLERHTTIEGEQTSVARWQLAGQLAADDFEELLGRRKNEIARDISVHSSATGRHYLLITYQRAGSGMQYRFVLFLSESSTVLFMRSLLHSPFHVTFVKRGTSISSERAVHINSAEASTISKWSRMEERTEGAPSILEGCLFLREAARPHTRPSLCSMTAVHTVRVGFVVPAAYEDGAFSSAQSLMLH